MAEAGDGRFSAQAKLGLNPDFLYDLLAPAWAENNQFIQVDFELISRFAAKLRDANITPDSMAEFDTLVARNSVEERRKGRLIKMIIDSVNGAPESNAPSLMNQVASKYLIRQVELRPTTELVEKVYAMAFGWGPLERFMGDRAVTEIMVNAWDRVFIERTYRAMNTGTIPGGVTFESPRVFESWLVRLTTEMGRAIGVENPTVDFVLADGSRGNATMYVSREPSLTIRRAQKQEVYTLEWMVEHGSMSLPMAAYLRTANAVGVNLITYGEVASGKTTLLGALIDEKPPEKRLIIVEDTLEIFVDDDKHPDVIRMVTMSPIREMRDLVRNALRQKPDHLIIGETRDATAYDLLQALSVGTQGSMSTLHASNPRNALDRLSALILQAQIGLGEHSVRQMVSEAIHILVHADRLPDGRRVIGSIDEVVGFEPDGSFLTRNVFHASVERDAEGHYTPTFNLNLDYQPGPHLETLMKERGIDRNDWTGAAMAARAPADDGLAPAASAYLTSTSAATPPVSGPAAAEPQASPLS
jgi:Flp pilus assembly CpaF family ATPase